MKKRLVISGIGFFAGIGHEKEEMWNAIVEGSKKPEAYSKVADLNTVAKCAFEMEGKISPNDFIENRTLKRMADFSKILCCASEFALKDAGINKNDEGYVPEKIGSIVCTVHGPMNVTFNYLDDLLTTGPATARPILFQQTVNNVACGQVAIQNKLKGVSSTIIGASSLCYAATLIRKGTADAILVAGHEELYQYVFAAYDQKRMLSTAKDGEERSIPYSPEANGIVLGEGAGALILETLESAKKRGAHIYAEFVEGAVVTDECFIKTFNEFSVEKSTGFARAMSLALHRGNVKENEVGFVSLCGNGLKNVDETEMKALKKVFHNVDELGFVASKAFMGETLGGSEVFAVAAALLCMEKGIVPGLAYLQEHSHESKNVAYCLVNSMFTGGNINSVLLKSYKED